MSDSEKNVKPDAIKVLQELPSFTLGQNLQCYELPDGKVAIVADMTQELGPSASGKTIMIASTNGTHKRYTPRGPVSISINAYKAK